MYKYLADIKTVKNRGEKLPDNILDALKNEKIAAKIDYEMFQSKEKTEEVKLE
jgi:hypothetical protein